MSNKLFLFVINSVIVRYLLLMYLTIKMKKQFMILDVY